MPVLKTYKDVEQVYKESGKIDAMLQAAKIDDKKIKAFTKELAQKKKRMHDTYLKAINDDNKIKNFKATSPTGDGGFSKELAAANKRVDITLNVKGGKVLMMVNTDIVAGV